MDKKKLLLDLLKQARDWEMEFAAGLSAEERGRIGTLEAWSAKDVISHITARKALMADGVIAVVEGEAPSGSDDLNGENASLYNEYHDKAWEEVHQIAQDTLGRIVARVGSLEEQDLARNARFFPWQRERPLWRLIVGSGLLHSVGHLAEFQRNRGDHPSAGKMIGEMARSMAALDDSSDWRGEVEYSFACQSCMLGDKAEALRRLRESLALNPGLAGLAKEDPDLEAIRDEPEFQALLVR